MPSQLFSFNAVGTVGDDFLLGAFGPGTTDGGDGDDYILGDSGNVFATGTSNSLAAPANIDSSSEWTTDENPFFGNATTTPHTSLYVLADAAQTHYSSVTVGAGESITVDIDFGGHPIGVFTNLVVELYNSSGGLITSNDDEPNFALGGGGSVSPFDSFLSYTNTTGVAQTYTIRFREYDIGDGGVFEGDETFVSNISVTGHAVIAPTVMGNDSLSGGNGDDTIAGQGGNDILFGNAGFDTLFGGSGNDTIDGGDGIDTADYADAATGVVVNLTLFGAAQNTVGAGTDTLSNIEYVSGSGFNDTLTGDGGVNVLIGQAGADVLDGGEANDTLLGDDGDDVLIGGSEDDSLYGGDGTDTASYAGNTTSVTVSLAVGGAQDTFGAGIDTLVSIENLTGTDFGDLLTGDSLANLLDGGNANDTLYGQEGSDSLFGGAGNDYLLGGSGNDRLDGGAGQDRASYVNTLTGVVVDLSETEQNTIGGGIDTLISIEDLVGSQSNDTLFGSAVANVINAGGGNDTVSAGDGDDVVYGENGDDTLIGGGGADTLYGDLGNNVLIGGTGNDVLYDGSGNDILAGGSGNDVIFDFGSNGNDAIDGGAGIDDVFYWDALGSVTVDLSTTAAQNTGGGGIDTISGVENLTGSEFNDSLTGNGGDNRITGLTGSDIINGGAGNDTLDGGSDNDTIDGGNGNDTASYGSAGGGVTVSLAAVGAQYTGIYGGTDTLANIENLIGSNYGDSLFGNSGINNLAGGAGNDSIGGGDGNDILLGEGGDDSLAGGNGNDTASYAGAVAGVVVSLAIGAQNTVGAGTDALISIERLTGSSFADTLTGDGGVNVLFGGGGIDILDGAAGNDSLLGDDGYDRLIGGAGDDSLSGGAGYDTASYVGAASGVTVNLTLAGAQNTGGAGSDTLVSIERATGSGFNDTLIGNALANVLSGEAGADVLDGGAGNDLLSGGAGFDTASYATNATAVIVTLASTAAQNTVGAGTDTLVSIENLTGSGFNDTLTGSVIANTLLGGGGNDTLGGGAGHDALNGGTGNDALSGGAGTDLFRFDNALSAATNVDTISDFSVADDTMHLAQSVFSAAGAPGTLAAAAFHTGAAAADASDRIIYNSATGQIFFDADGTGGGAQILFAQVTVGLALSNADFSVYIVD